MNRENLDYIQSSICYRFENLNLLIQAFTRKSYSEEKPGTENNEVLEFYGDEILDLYVTKLMYKETGKVSEKGFVSSRNEGELTRLKAAIVNKNSLAACIKNFGFEKFLIMGNSDIQNNVQESLSVREDLFEAIIGAVAVDSDWDYEALDKVCKNMLQMAVINGYLEVLVNEKARILGLDKPVYSPVQYSGYDSAEWSFDLFNLSFYQPHGYTSKNPETGLYEYSVSIGEKKFLGTGDGIYQAFLDCNSQAYKWLCQVEVSKTFQNLDFENPVSALHELNQKKIIMLLGYVFNEYHDSDGNPVWRCSVFVEGLYGDFTAEGVSKKVVKQQAAKKVLMELVNANKEL
ncbi:MAG: putative dsRNA-binding protein [Spirochaetia bacterium]|nr:putative dsRNA-binding protein [Spirochaetia bacterium]MDD7698672.1 ribonuclease III domain-containing protein [Spirochaetia bacterium]MDY4211713.1 ribonuclease III domain-containing protein [Treponema sp.]